MIGNKVHQLGKPIVSVKPVNLKVDRHKFREFVGKLSEMEKITDERSFRVKTVQLQDDIKDYIENGIASGVSVKNGKLLFRQPDNTLIRDTKGIIPFKQGMDLLNKERSFLDEQLNNAIAMQQPTEKLQEMALHFQQADDNIRTFMRVNKRIHGDSLSPLSEAIPVISAPLTEQTNNYGSINSLRTEILDASMAAKKSGAKLDFDVVFLRDQPRSWFPKPATSYVASKDQVNIGSNMPGYAFHEFTHAKHNENKLFKGLYDANEHFGTGMMVAYPAALAFGQDIKDAIPGKTDDKVVDAISNWGPEAYLASRTAGRGIEEFRTYKATKKYLDSEYGGTSLVPPSNLTQPGAPLKDIVNAHRWNLASYPIASGMVYGGMRAGGLMLDKEGSVAKDIVSGPFQDMYYSIKRGVQSAPHAGRIMKSMIMSSPAAPPPAWWSTAGITLVPLSLLYGVHSALDFADTPKTVVKNQMESTFL